MTREDFFTAIVPWGYSDVEATINTLNAVGFNESEYADYLNEYIESIGIEGGLEDIDPVAIAYEMSVDRAKDDIAEFTDSEEINMIELPIFANYLDSHVSPTNEDAKRVKEIINSIEESSRTDAIKWLLDELDGY